MKKVRVSVTTEVIEQEVIEEQEDAATPEKVAGVVAGVPMIGHARNLLELEGWEATIWANRITVNHEIVAQYVSSNGHFWWQVYRADGTPPVFIVGTEVAS